MSHSKPSINPYYSKWDTPKPQNRFQRAVFNGRTTKVKDLIASGENVYVTTDLDETPLFVAIVRGHQSIVNEILDIYEDDLQFVRHYFKEKHNKDCTEKPVFVAHGADKIRLVNELSVGMEAASYRCSFDETKTMVILLKSSQEKRILWLRPNSHEDNIKVAKIVECIWNDGVIDLHHAGHWGRTVFDVAAIRNHPELYCRFVSLSTVKPEKSVEHILQMCIHHREGQLDFFKKICNQTGRQLDKIVEILSTNVDLLVLPTYYDLFEMFVFFMESLVDKMGITSEHRAEEMNKILSSYKIKTGSSMIETIIWADNKEFVERCLVYFKPNLLSLGTNNEPVLQSLIAQKSSEFMTQFIVGLFDQVQDTVMEAQILMQLIEQNWFDAVKMLYDRYTSTRSVLFRNKKRGVQCLLNAIDGCRYDLTNYLVDAHRDELTDPDDVLQLVLYCAFVRKSKDVLRTLLTLPAADVLRTSGPEHYYNSPIYVALKFRHLDNYRLLLDSVTNLQGLHGLKEDNGENLLFPAIWFKENPVDETPFVYVEEEHASLEVVDSSDDEDDAVRKEARNKQIMTSTGPYKDPIMPDSYFEKQSNEMKRIFDYYLNELCLDYRCVNSQGESLLHVAVKRDNYDAVKQLLVLGLDPNARDSEGNYPIHFVRSSVVLNMLLDSSCDINVTNDAAETPLLCYVKSITDIDEDPELRAVFLLELLRARADINQTDAHGSTALHLVKHGKIAQVLLQNGAAINAKNFDGETPILYIFHEQVGAQSLYKVLLCDERLDLMVVSNKNVSILSVLVSLDNETMEEVLLSLSNHSKTNELDDLFTHHCNSVDHCGYPVLLTACFVHTNSYCLEKLLNNTRLDPNIHTEHYQPLEVESPTTIQRLIDRGANVNGFGDGNRKTPLMNAIGGRNPGDYRSNFESVSVLLAAGADLNVLDPDGDSALDYASRLENFKDARRTIAALILGNAKYNQQSCEKESKFIKIAPFECFFFG